MNSQGRAGDIMGMLPYGAGVGLNAVVELRWQSCLDAGVGSIGSTLWPQSVAHKGTSTCGCTVLVSQFVNCLLPLGKLWSPEV